MEVTAVEVSVSLLIMKLRNLAAERAVNPDFRRRAEKSIKILEELQKNFLEGGGTEQDLSIQHLQQLRDIYSFNNAIDKVLFKSMLHRGLLMRKSRCNLLPRFSIRNNRWSSSSQMDNVANNLRRRIGSPEGSEKSLPPQRKGEESDDIVGMKDRVELLDHLVRGSHKLPFIISMTGVAGSGKTTLARKIFDMLHVKQQFECCAWINVSREVQAQMVLMEALRQTKMTRQRGRHSLEYLHEDFRDLLSKKRCLIVLDDVHSPDIWQQLKLAVPDQLNGSRLIIIAQDSSNLEQIPVLWSWPICMRPLNMEENFELLKKEMVEEPDDDYFIKLILFFICEGIPLKILFLAGLVQTKNNLNKLMNFLLDDEESPSLINFENIWKNISASDDPFIAGYLGLPASSKACLLYMGLFPRSYEVPVRRLVRLWIAEGLAVSGEALSHVQPEDVAEEHFNKLVGKKLIEVAKKRFDGSPKTCLVPGILHEKLFPIAADMGFLHVHRGTHGIFKTDFNFQRLADYADISEKSSPFYIQDIRSYISFCKRLGDEPVDHVPRFLNKISARRGFGLLAVLDLERVYKPALPETLGKLLLLKYLGLRWTYLDAIPESVRELINLETLDVKHTNITTLPISFRKAKKLRHLYLNNIQFDIPRTKFYNLEAPENLRTLTGLLISGKSSIIKWLEKRLGLKKLGLTCHMSSIQKIMDLICKKLKVLQSLTLKAIDDFFQPAEVDLGSLEHHTKLNELYLVAKLPSIVGLLNLPKNLRILTLSCSGLEADPLRILGDKLPQLNILRLFAGSYRGKSMTSLQDHFPELRLLQLWMLEELEKWTLKEGALPSLTKLEIRRCSKLKHTIGLQKLATLKELILTNMPDGCGRSDSDDFSEEIKAIIRRKRVFVKTNNFDFTDLPK